MYIRDTDEAAGTLIIDGKSGGSGWTPLGLAGQETFTVPDAVVIRGANTHVKPEHPGMTLQFGESAEVFSWGTLVLLMPLSGVFYPVEALPGILQPLARIIPLSRVFDAARDSLAGVPVNPWDLIIGALGSLVAVAAAAWFVNVQLRRFRENGWITRFS